MTRTMKTRLPKSERSLTPPVLVLQERDIKLFELLAKYRYLRTSQIHDLVFPGRAKNAVIRRLTKLFHNGYIDRVFTQNTNSNAPGESCYFIDRGGYNVIVHESSYEGRFHPKNKSVSPLFLNHTLAVIEFRILFEKSIMENPIAHLPEKSWISEYDIDNPTALKKTERYVLYDEVYDTMQKRNITVYPDAMFLLHGKGKYESYQSLYFVEIDRGTESSSKIKQKFFGYQLYRHYGKYKKFGNVKSFAVLFVTTSKKRINTITENLREEAELQHVLFTDFESTRNNNVCTSEIWQKFNGEKISLIRSNI